MKIVIKRLAFAMSMVGIGSVVLSGCGGGGGGGGGGISAEQISLSGTAATGAAFTDATVEVRNSKNEIVGTSEKIGTDGQYSIKLKLGSVAPFVISAERTSEDGSKEILVSVIAEVTGNSAVANITPITHLIASRLSESGDPSKLSAELKDNIELLSKENLDIKKVEVAKILAPILEASETNNADPLTGIFKVNGDGYDRLLDSIKISVVPDSATTANIEIGIRQKQADQNAEPVNIQFSSKDPAEKRKDLPPIIKDSLADPGTAGLINEFLVQLTRCYALPVGERVNAPVVDGLATGNATNIASDVCKNVFHASNPANFKSNGKSVGRDSNDSGAFTSLFKDKATGVVFSQGSYEFTRESNDIVAGYKSRDSAGNEVLDTFVLRKDVSDNKLKLIGNQYVYGGGVTAYQQLRTFVNDPASNYFSTGYALNVPLNSGVAYIKVTTPKTSVLTLIRGSDGMVFPKVNGENETINSNNAKTTSESEMLPGGTSFIRLRSEYVSDSSSPKQHPRLRDTSLFFSTTDSTDLEISSYSNNGVWVIKYYDSTGKVLDTQSYKTRARANTIAELRTQKWATLNDSTLTDLKKDFIESSGLTTNGYTKLPTSGLVQPTWVVPTGALPPTEIKLFGKAGPNVDGSGSKVNFNDGQTAGSTTRSVIVKCKNGSGEKHCLDNGIGYTTSAIATGLHLWAREPSGREYTNFYAGYKLN